MSKEDILLKAKKDRIKVSGISFDTRTLDKNNIFFAIQGLNDDGLNILIYQLIKEHQQSLFLIRLRK